MLARIRKSADEKDQGFTLIELLVVIIIIGILAAIAIPVFLNQRKKGWDAQAKSDLKNMATAEETYLTDTGIYTSQIADLSNVGFKQSADNTSFVVFGDAGQNYCLGVTSKSGLTWKYVSSAGVPSQGSCTSATG
jgi:type IV pilus assembly protein PilA